MKRLWDSTPRPLKNYTERCDSLPLSQLFGYLIDELQYLQIRLENPQHAIKIDW